MSKLTLPLFLLLLLVGCEDGNPIECRGTNGLGADAHKGHSPDDGDFVRLAYRVVLQREFDPEGLSYHCKLLSAGKVDRIELIKSFVNSDEARQLMNDKK
jgi:hypothetical protein